MSEAVARRSQAEILRNPPASEWPDDDRIVDAIHLHAGILGLAAAELGVDEAKLSEYIAARKDMTETLRRVVASGDWLADKHIRMGCQEGDPGYIALRLRQQQLAQQAGGQRNAPRAVDYTREIGAVEELTDAECLTILYNDLLAHPPPDTEECPLCHRPAAMAPKWLDI